MVEPANAIQANIDAACRKLEETVRDFGIVLTQEPADVEGLEEVLLAVKESGDAAALNGACFMVGAYLGELIRQRLGGQWVASADGVVALQLNDGGKVFAIDKTKKFAARPDDDGLVFYIRALLAKARQ